jgi:hypothetical protein
MLGVDDAFKRHSFRSEVVEKRNVWALCKRGGLHTRRFSSYKSLQTTNLMLYTKLIAFF